MPEHQTILVTGAAGFIGMHVARVLLDRGHTVVGLDNLNDYYDVNLKKDRLAQLEVHDRFFFSRLDLECRQGVAEAFAEYRPDAVIHLAAQAGVRYSLEHPFTYVDSNVTGQLSILEACRRFPVSHLVFASSSSVYGANRKLPFSESDRVDHPVSLYAATKRAAELMAYSYARLYGIAATGLRFFTVYGPWGRPDMAYFSFTRDILAGRTIRLFNFGDMKRDFTFISDIVEGVLAVLGRPAARDPDGVPFRIYNIGNDQPVSLGYFVEVLEKILGVRAIKEMCPMQAGDVLSTHADISALRREFGFDPATGIEEGLATFVSWYREYYKEDHH
jgi:UDP-glucuronate 4-epimerase